MRAILTITLNDLRIFFAHRTNLVGLLIMPVLLSVGLGYAFGSEGNESTEIVRVDVLNYDQTPRSERFLGELYNLNKNLRFCPLNGFPSTSLRSAPMVLESCDTLASPPTLETGLANVEEGESAALLIIPAGFAASLESFTPIEIDYYTAANPASPDPVREAIETVTENINRASLAGAVAAALVEQYASRSDIEPLIHWREPFVQAVITNTEMRLAQLPSLVHLTTSGGNEISTQNEGFGQSVPGVGSMFVMFTVLGGMTSLLRERRNWTLQRLGTLPVTRGQILAGKALTYFTLGIVQYLIVFAVGLSLELDLGPNPTLLLTVMVAFTLCCTALAFALAPFMRSEGQANVTSQLLGLTFASLGGAWWPLEIVPRYMQQIGHLSPIAWAMDAFRDLLFYQGDVAAIAPEMAILLTATALLFAFGAWRFSYI